MAVPNSQPSELSESSSSSELFESSDIRESSPSSTESPTSSGSVQASTCKWNRSFLDKLGLHYQSKQPFDIVAEHMSSHVSLTPIEIKDLEKVVEYLSILPYLEKSTENLFEIDFVALQMKMWQTAEEIPMLQKQIPFKEIDV
jgi:hypothetical protein